jgi:hypothetical protein
LGWAGILPWQDAGLRCLRGNIARRTAGQKMIRRLPWKGRFLFTFTVWLPCAVVTWPTAVAKVGVGPVEPWRVAEIERFRAEFHFQPFTEVESPED